MDPRPESENASAPRLLAADDPFPVIEERSQGASSFVVVVDHASARLPRRVGTLGLPHSELARHIAWDIGALEIARGVSAALDATLLAQNYSRLMIDCNRDPNVESSIPVRSEITEIPGNVGLTSDDIAARRNEIFEPYHARLSAILDARRDAGRRTILVAQHSMTDIYLGVRRSMHAAVLYNRDRRFAGRVLEALRRDPSLTIADNEPYFVSDATDYTIPRHAERRGLPHVEIEIRQDLLAEESGRQAWVRRLTEALREAERAYVRGESQDQPVGKQAR